MPSVVYVGRRVTGPEIDRGELSPGDMRACVYVGPAQHVWAYSFRAWIGRLTGSNANVRFAYYDAGGAPSDRRAYSLQVAVTTAYVDISGGSEVSAAIAVNDLGPSTKGIPILAGDDGAIAILCLTNPISHSMRAAAAITAPDENFYDRSGISSPPPDPYGATVGVNNGHVSTWLVCDTNDPPLRGINRSPSGNITDTTPTFTWDFRDLNGVYGPGDGGADRGDQVSKYRIQLRAQGSGTLILNQEYVATSAEIAASAITRTPGISPLAPGTYEWRQQDADYFGQYYAWSSADWLTFTIPSADQGIVTLDGDPAGSHYNSVQPTYNARWHHPSGLAMTHARLQLLDGDTNDVVRDSGWQTKAVVSSALPGTNFTFSPAQLNFPDRSWGKKYKYRVAGRDSAAVESQYSANRQFITNYAPTVPSNLTPVSQGPYADPPLITGKWSDVDDTPVGSGSGTQALTGTFRIRKPSSATVDVTPTWDAASGSFRFQLTTIQLDEGFGTYSFTATGSDGLLWSGEGLSLATATFSGSRTFVYADGPDVVVNTPLPDATITAAELPVEWTPSEQAQWRVILDTAGTEDGHYDTGWVVEPATRAHTIPSGSYLNGGSYDLRVGVKSALGLEGWSTAVRITISYVPPPSLLDYVVEASRIGNEPWETAIRGAFTASVEEGFLGYVVRRSASGGPDESEITWLNISSQSQTEFVDYHVASGYEYTYQVAQMVEFGGEVLLSEFVTGSAIITLPGVVLVSVTNPGTARAIVRRTGKGRKFTRRRDEAFFLPPARTVPFTVRRRARYWEPAIMIQLIEEDGLTARQARWGLEALDEEAGTLSYRDEEQRKLFCQMPTFEVADELIEWHTATIGLREEGFVEAVVTTGGSG